MAKPPRTGGTTDPDRGCRSNKSSADESATHYVGTYNVGKCNVGCAVRGYTVAARCNDTAVSNYCKAALTGRPDKEMMVQI